MMKSVVKSGRKLIAEEIYYISINPMRIENYRAVAPAYPHHKNDLDLSLP
jgi:hypothetical protein